MAIVPKDSIFASQSVKPSSFVVWCLLCQVKDKRQKDVYLDSEKAQQAGIKKSAYYFAFSELESKGWIAPSASKNGQKRWFLVKGFSANVENDGLEDSANVETDSMNVENNSANVEFSYKEINRPKEPTEENQPNEIYSAPDLIIEKDLGLVDFNHAEEIEKTFIWLRDKKSRKFIPQTEWLDLFAELEVEGITLDGFREFYLWVENLDWVTGTVSVNLLRGQIEAYINREHLEAKRIIKQGNQNGKISNTNDRTAQTAKQIEGSQRLDAIIADAERFKSPTIN
jgi:hypothetical protein